MKTMVKCPACTELRSRLYDYPCPNCGHMWGQHWSEGSMRLEDFKGLVERTWNKELSDDDRKAHALILLQGEAAEVADIWKKAKYSNRTDLPKGIDMVHLAEEVGDVMYGVIAVCREFDLDLEWCLAVCARKLEKRYENSPGE